MPSSQYRVAAFLAGALCSSLPASAQTCPAFDSLVHAPAPTKNRYHAQYDRLTDSTSYALDLKIAMPKGLSLNDPQIDVEFYAIHAGQTVDSLGAFRFFLKATTQTPQEGALDRVETRSKLADAEEVPMLIDDSVRVRLKRVDYRPGVRRDIGLGRNLKEVLLFELTREDWIKMANGSQLAVRVGEKTITMGKNQPEGARGIIRRAVCR